MPGQFSPTLAYSYSMKRRCVDPETERLIQQAMKALLAGRTAFIIAHRLSTVRAADRIMVIEDGKIAEQGTHEELVRLGGKYAALYEAQFKRQEDRATA